MIAHIEPLAPEMTGPAIEYGAPADEMAWAINHRHDRPRRFPPARITPIQLRKKAIGWERTGGPKLGASDLRVSTAQVGRNFIAFHGARSMGEAIARMRLFQITPTPEEIGRARHLLGDGAKEAEIVMTARVDKVWLLRNEHGVSGAHRSVARLALARAARAQMSTFRLRATPRRAAQPRSRRAPRVARMASATPPASDGPTPPPTPPRRAPRAAGGDS
jgi:hypothetical protein